MKALTVRLPEDQYGSLHAITRLRKTTVSGIIRECIAVAIREFNQQQLFEEYERLGQDREQTDVEFAIPAQWEVIKQDDYA